VLKVLHYINAISTMCDLSGMNDEMRRDASFLFPSREEPETNNAASQFIQQNILSAMDQLNENESSVKETLDSEGGEAQSQDDKRNAEERLEPREYQLMMFEEIKKRRGTIVSLPTGCGKTLIAMMAIKYFLEEEFEKNRKTGQNPKQILFMAPTVTLTEQHEHTLKCNYLTSKFKIACINGSKNSSMASILRRVENAQILIGTHGSILDLYRHYSHIFSLLNVSLLILDECHHAGLGEHGYSQFLREFFEGVPSSKRPRVLGLTASAAVRFSEESQLYLQLNLLEAKLDAQIISMDQLPSAKIEERGGNVECAQVIDEAVVCYDNSTCDFEGLDDSTYDVAQFRRKEIGLLKKLYKDLGPLVTSVYCEVLIKELSIAEFYGESQLQFDVLKRFLKETVESCRQQCSSANCGGKTSKLIELEKIMVDLKSDDTGILFVDMRVTALALFSYFKNQRSSNEVNTVTIKADYLVRGQSQIFKYLNKSPQDVDEDYEWVHARRPDSEILDQLRSKDIDVLICTTVAEEGVDVPSCSYVIAFDGISTNKSYVQMKGRSRKNSAKFFVFHDQSSDRKKKLALSKAQDAETLVRKTLNQRSCINKVAVPINVNLDNSTERSSEREDVSGAGIVALDNLDCDQDEVFLLNQGIYRTKFASVNLNSAKSLLNQYLQKTCRTNEWNELGNKSTSIYDKDRLQITLPTHIDPSKRIVDLPKEFRGKSKDNRQKLLAFLTCIRLHRWKMLNDNLKPCHDETNRLVASKVIPLISMKEPAQSNCVRPCHGEKLELHMFVIMQTGNKICAHEDNLLQKSKRKLAVLCSDDMPDIPTFAFQHSSLGNIYCKLVKICTVSLSSSQWKTISDFFLAIMDNR